ENRPAGDYTVTLTAVASSEENNSVAPRVYRNKALTRVSQFSVIEPSTLLFNAVDNAEKYLITIDCGDKNHNHVNFDNGLSTNFNFADCMMQNSGIKFTVTAVANGFASSVSQQFVYAPKLDAITEFSLDAQTQVLTWNKVANATGYMVSVKCGNSAHGEEFVNIGAVNSIGLKECASIEGGIVVKVYPVSKWFVSSEAATYTFNKQNLATPQNIRIKGTVVSWDEVSGAQSYTVMIANRSFTTNTNSIDLAGANLVEKEYYTLSVVAKAGGAQDSIATDLIDARNLAMAETLRYEGSVLSWAHVIGAASYDVQVNDGEVFSVSDGANFANINLTQAGENVLKVRFIGDEGSAFEWVTLSVYAHTLTFISDGGSSVEQQFKAVGDLIELPAPEKTGYDFLAWYNTPNGPESNGAAFKELTFTSRGDIVLYACYTPKKYTVTYHYGDGGNGSSTSDGVYYQKHYQLTVPQLNDSTSAFGGWFSAPNGNGIQLTDDKGNSLSPWTKTDNADAYAYYFDDVLTFTLIESSTGRATYAVMRGSRIDQVSEVTIPQTYKGVKVDRISGNAFNGCANLVTINVPNTIETISEVNTFSGCVNLCAINVYEVEGVTSYRYWSSAGVLFDNGQ
ncbi:MAG: InlB B-repeat-containing protein, partial [Clostridia bacterium]|nr:InlB B-repeat-containing protein [Clostridia bacterium]